MPKRKFSEVEEYLSAFYPSETGRQSAKRIKLRNISEPETMETEIAPMEETVIESMPVPSRKKKTIRGKRAPGIKTRLKRKLREKKKKLRTEERKIKKQIKVIDRDIKSLTVKRK